MRSNYLQPKKKAQISRKAMAGFMTRVAVDDRMEKIIKKHEDKRIDELSAFAGAVDANWLYTLHKELGFGRKRLRRIWKAMVKNRIEFREFFRDGTGGYKEQPTGQNVEDEATVKALLDIGVDIRAWERQEIIVDHNTGNITFKEV
jgi:hypothetical protein